MNSILINEVEIWKERSVLMKSANLCFQYLFDFFYFSSSEFFFQAYFGIRLSTARKRHSLIEWVRGIVIALHVL